MAALLLKENATVTLCHSRTKDLAAVTREADIVVAAVGRAAMLGAEQGKGGSDRHRNLPDLLTVAMLLFNTLKAFRMRHRPVHQSTSSDSQTWEPGAGESDSRGRRGSGDEAPHRGFAESAPTTRSPTRWSSAG